MRLALTVVSPMARQWADVVIDADPATPVGELAAELDRLASGGFTGEQPPAGPGHAQVLQFPAPRARGPLAVAGQVVGYPSLAQAVPLYVDFQRVAPQLTLAQSPIRDGAVLSLGSPEGCLRPEPTGLVEIKIVGGPAAGAVHRLSLGDADIGSANTATIVIADQSVPPLALRVSHRPAGRHSGSAVRRGRGHDGPGADHGPDAVARRAADRDREHADRPRALRAARRGAAPLGRRRGNQLQPATAAAPAAPGTKFRLPSPPDKQQRRSLPILTALAPLLMGVALYFVVA